MSRDVSGFTECRWCKHAPQANCAQAFAADEKFICDFRLLPFERGAILDRMRLERSRIDEMKGQVLSRAFSSFDGVREAQRLTNEILDRTYGLQVMADVLVKEFGMTLEELKSEVGFESVDSQRERTRAKLALLKSRRGSK